MLARRRARRKLLRTVGQTASILLCSGLLIVLLVVTRRSSSTEDDLTGSFAVSNFYTTRDGQFATEYVVRVWGVFFVCVFLR